MRVCGEGDVGGAWMAAQAEVYGKIGWCGEEDE